MACGDCGGSFELSARRARAYRSAGSAPRCAGCRSTREPKVTPAMRRYWLDRFTLDELRELAAGLWPNG